MALTVLITLTTAGADTGPFDLYSDVDGYVTPFETGIAKATLEAGYLSSSVPDGALTVRVQSDSVLCENYVDLPIFGFTTTTTTSTSTSTTTTTSTSTSTSTTSTTTTAEPPSFTLDFDFDVAVTDVRINAASIAGFPYPVNSFSTPISENFTPAGPLATIEIDAAGSPGASTLRIIDSVGNHDLPWIGDGTYTYFSIDADDDITFTMVP